MNRNHFIYSMLHPAQATLANGVFVECVDRVDSVDRRRLDEFDKTVLEYREKYVKKHGQKICQPEFK